MSSPRLLPFWIFPVLILVSFLPFGHAGEVTGSIVDAETGQAIEARLTIVSGDGKTHYHAESKGRAGLGVAIPYEKRRGPKSVEIHTALSADPFRADLPPGRYLLRASRGPEYQPATAEITVPEEGNLADPVELSLSRWIDMAARGWFSGDLHCHLPLENLKTELLASDLNVTFPLTYWVTDTGHTPTENNKEGEPTPRPFFEFADSTHGFWPINTEYELFTHEEERHPLGAVLVLRHREPFDFSVPPLAPLIEASREQGAIFDLDKHNWPWSMILPPLGAADLFELTNNHVWETEFAFTEWNAEYVPDYMGIPPGPDGKGFDERGWIDFGFQNYYALLNCGLRLAPSAGTATGVHPVALGFGRVYVRMPDRNFDFDEWMDGLKAGRSFVTTGPMLFLTAAETHPGTALEWDPAGEAAKGSEEEGDGVPVILRVESEHPIESLELVVNGEPISLEIGGPIGARAPHSAMARVRVPITHTSWIAARVFTHTENDRPRFAHTAPVWVEVEDKPLVPGKLESNYLVERVEAELERHKGVLPEEMLEDFEEAAEFYREKRKLALEKD